MKSTKQIHNCVISTTKSGVSYYSITLGDSGEEGNLIVLNKPQQLLLFSNNRLHIPIITAINSAIGITEGTTGAFDVKSHKLGVEIEEDNITVSPYKTTKGVNTTIHMLGLLGEDLNKKANAIRDNNINKKVWSVA